jgi:hypothetical protein
VLIHRNMTELVDVVVNVSAYLTTLPQIIQETSNRGLNSTIRALTDFPNCGIRNNDTFNVCPSTDPSSPDCDPSRGGQANASWSLECLWDCAWQNNPHFGKIYNLTAEYYNIRVIITMPKVPIDLLCLDGCTTTRFPATYTSNGVDTLLDCHDPSFPSFIACYLLFTNYQDPWSVDNTLIWLWSLACWLFWNQICITIEKPVIS